MHGEGRVNKTKSENILRKDQVALYSILTIEF